uniref:Venom protein family 2 protein 9 n=1 Tax=Platymeris rhadamanthus TaxID=1134088 RepID=A0A6B9KZ32_PLARH|nr:venom protein family 2 protein 9 [Platymeris rhadamanthus]
MKSLTSVIFLALLVGVLGRTVPSEDEHTLQAIKELRHMASSRFLSDVSEPTCTDKKKENSIECCISMKWMKQKRTICIELGFNTTRLQVDFALYFDGEQIIDHALSVGELCAPLPGLLKKLNICVHAYYVDVDTKPPRISFDACFVVKLGGFFHLRLNCIKLDKNGKFSQNADIKPESKGILMLSLEDGNVKFDVHNPIPKDVMDKIEKGWSIFEKEASNFVDNAGKQISDVAKQVEKELDKATDKAKEAIVNEFNKATAAIAGIGDKISGLFG